MGTNGYKKRSKKYRKWLATKAQRPIGARRADTEGERS